MEGKVHTRDKRPLGKRLFKTLLAHSPSFVLMLN